MSACMIQSKNGPQYQNTVKEKFTNNQMMSHDQRKSKSAYTSYVMMSEQNPTNAKL